MAFNYVQARREAANPLQLQYASPAYFDVYFDAPPNVYTNFNDPDASILDSITKAAGTVGSVVSNIIFGDPSQIRFRVKGVDLPQRQLESLPRFTNGPQRLVPYGLVYSTINLEIIESDSYKIREFFETWQDLIYKKDNGYQVAYYNELISNKLKIVAYSGIGQPVRVWTMKEVYPIAINSSQMSWDAANQYLVINVELAFHEWDATDPKTEDYVDAVQEGLIGIAKAAATGGSSLKNAVSIF